MSRRRNPEPGADQATLREAKRALARLERVAKAKMAHVAQLTAACKPGKRLCTAELLALPDAAMIPELAEHVADAYEAARMAALGLGHSIMTECITCRAPWATHRAPVGVLRITSTRPDFVGVSLVCTGCARLDAAELKAAIIAAVKSDFLGGQGEEVTAAMIGPEGRA